MQEKPRLDVQGSVCESAQGRLHRRRIRTVLAMSVTGISVLSYFSGFIPFASVGSQVESQLAATQPSQQWKWADIEPSRNLEWHKCYENKFDCARLDVRNRWPHSNYPTC